jgi:tetratricopeptide (TPR) repeat protein
MNFPRDSLILALALIAAPAFAATPKRPAVKPPPPLAAAAPALSATDLIAQAQAAQTRGEKELAVRLAQSAIVANPALPAAYNALGDLYAADGDADYARFYYRGALTIDPSDADATKAMAALERGDDQRAAKADTNQQ